MGLTERPNPEVLLDSIPRIKPGLTHYVPVTLKPMAGGHLTASRVRGNGSGDLTSLGTSDGFVEILPDAEINADSRYPFYTWEVV